MVALVSRSPCAQWGLGVASTGKWALPICVTCKGKQAAARVRRMSIRVIEVGFHVKQ